MYVYQYLVVPGKGRNGKWKNGRDKSLVIFSVWVVEGGGRKGIKRERRGMGEREMRGIGRERR